MTYRLDLRGRTVLVIGALGTIGSAITDTVRAANGDVIRADVSFPQGILEEGQIALDATQYSSVQSTFQELRGKITDIVSTVGMLATGNVRDIDTDHTDQVIKVNLVAQLYVLSEGLKCLPEGGTITVLSSQAAQHGAAGWGLYSATKSALIRLVESAAKEEGASGIRVNAIAPGSVDSPMMERVIAEAALRTEVSESEIRARYKASSPRGRMVRPQEIANTVGFLISPLSEFISGQCIIIDGGEGPA